MKMAFLVFAATLFGAGAAWSGCDSGPDYCTDDQRIPGLLKEKKDRLSAEYPKKLVDLIDLGVQCVARIQQSPDGFSILEISKRGDALSLPWAEDTEDVSKSRLKNGEIVRYWLMNTRHAFQCDGEKPYDERADYDASDDINTSLALKCAKAAPC